MCILLTSGSIPDSTRLINIPVLYNDAKYKL